MQNKLDELFRQAESVILGKPQAIRLAVTCLLAQGHLLIEDRPGVGKTTLAHLLARLLGLRFQRIQFTSDLLPADILGTAVYERDSSRFVFHPGPIFAQLVLADEVNRATPKAQSALLEAMGEGQVTTEGETRALPTPFFVIATQNPVHQLGTFPLPESQLDRFLMRIEIGYPDRSAERDLLRGQDRRRLIEDLETLLPPEDLESIQAAVARVHCADAVVEYVQHLIEHTRDSGAFRLGLSPRAGQGIIAAARAWTYLDGRSAVLPEDIQAVFPAVAGHRLQVVDDAGGSGPERAQQMLDDVAIP
jgi:MoxR-like ATPase